TWIGNEQPQRPGQGPQQGGPPGVQTASYTPGGGDGGGRGGGGDGRGGGDGTRGGRDGGQDGGRTDDGTPVTQASYRSPASPQEAPETLAAAQEGGFLPRPGAAAPTVGGGTSSGGQTWFLGKPWRWTDPSGRVWHDTGAERNREGPFASGLPPGTPGFASPGRKGLGGWYELTLPDGRKYVTRKVDIGPRGVIDLSAGAAYEIYGSPGATEKQHMKPIRGRYLGSNLPRGGSPGIQGVGAGGIGALPPGAAARAVYGPEGTPMPGDKVPGGIVSPVSGTFVGGPASHFHASRGKGRLHSGADWQAENYSPVKAMAGGEVVHVGHHGGYGWTVDVRMANGDVVRYGTHGDRPGVRLGDKVSAGQQLGTIGKGHLHQEVIKADY